MRLSRYVRDYGLFGLIEELLLRRALWNLSGTSFKQLGQASSFSDNDEYVSIVELAAKDDEVFKKFRSNREYRKILEHVTKSLGTEYLTRVSVLDPNFAKSLELLAKIDSIGGPLRYRFWKLGRFSPTTFRYLYVHLMLIKYFGDISNSKIIEIGGGFGGQATVSTTLIPTLQWTIYDLPKVLELQRKFVLNVNPHLNVNFSSGLDVVPASGDILISNYALSEISRDLQVDYINKVVLNCPKGFMTWNLISEKTLGGLSVSEITAMIPTSVAIGESPLTDSGNVFIIWGHRKNV